MPAPPEFAELRELLLGEEQRKLTELERRLDAPSRGAEELAEQLPEAIALRAGRDKQLARALAPTLESAIGESVRRNPRQIATAIFPILGPAIRKALAETMAALVDSINRAVEHAFSLRGLAWRIEAWRTGTPYAQIVLKHALVYRVEQVFLIHAETGLLLAHAAPAELKVADADLVSGMLTAIQDFVSDSFHQQEAGGGQLRTFSVGELTVMVESGPQAVLAAVVRGQPPESLLHKLQDTLETIHLQFAAAFADFQGNTTPFAPVQPLLESCLETVLAHQRPRANRRLHWLRWAVPALLLAGFLVWRAWRADARFDRAVATLEAEPGIQIVAAERDGGRWRLRGLKDPLARDPQVVLAGFGSPASRLDGRWEPYLSLEPSLVVTRAARALTAPGTLTFRLRQDTLYAMGEATLDWIAKVTALPFLPAGVTALDLSGVKPMLPPEIARLKELLDGSRVLFDVGSAVLRPGQLPGLESVATWFRELQAGVDRLGYRSELVLSGRTDASGSDGTNQRLSGARIEAVRLRLLRFGLSPDWLRGVPLGTGSPLAGRDSLEQARINRSVSFEARVGR